MGGLAGLRVLDLGCGDGRTAVWFALSGAIVVGVDVSEGSLAVARRRAALHKVTATTKFLQVPAEDLAAAFGAGSFDSVFGYAVIHHTSLPVLTANLAGVLRGNGTCAFPFEPIAFWPPAERFRKSKLMRKIAPVGNETEDESIIFSDDLSALETDFVVEVSPFHLTTQVQALIPAKSSKR